MSRNILLVEDDMLLSTVQKRLVERLGYTVAASVQTGQAAIEEVQSKKLDLILMDILLGEGMNGIEAMQEIRKHSSVPVIYLSGDSKWKGDKDIVSPVDYLTKPIQLHQLASSFEKAFGVAK